MQLILSELETSGWLERWDWKVRFTLDFLNFHIYKEVFSVYAHYYPERVEIW